MKRLTRSEVEESLMEHLAISGGMRPHYIDLLQDYMSLWDTKRKLIADIRKRGVVYEDVSSVGVKMQKNNPSVKELVGVNRQMLAILEKLKLSTTTVGSGDEDEL